MTVKRATNAATVPADGGTDPPNDAAESPESANTPADEPEPDGDSETETESTSEDDAQWRRNIEQQITEIREGFSRIVAREQTAPRTEESVTVVMPPARNHSETSSETTATETENADSNGQQPEPKPRVGGVMSRRRHPR